mgnify:CR=1 FL=1
MINYEPEEVDYDEELIYEGATVWFTDPDNEISSGLYTVERINGEVYSLSGGIEAYEHELEIRYDWATCDTRIASQEAGTGIATGTSFFGTTGTSG